MSFTKCMVDIEDLRKEIEKLKKKIDENERQISDIINKF